MAASDVPKPTSTENEPVQQPEPVPVSDNGNHRSQRLHKTTVKYQPHNFIAFSASRHQLLLHATKHASALHWPLEAQNLCMRSAFQAEAVQALPDNTDAFSTADFEPVPSHQKHIMSLPKYLKLHC